jgi:hypothetical protein
MGFTPTGASRQSKYIESVGIKEALRYSPHLRFEDRRELMGVGHHPMVALPLSVGLSSDPIKFFNQDRQVAGFAGVVDEGNGVGRIWMLCTPAVEKMPFILVREAKEWISSQPYHMLHNIADPRNRAHLKLLTLLGFKRLSYVPVGPKRHTYVEFAKLCAIQ